MVFPPACSSDRAEGRTRRSRHEFIVQRSDTTLLHLHFYIFKKTAAALFLARA
jgi:hypothetical protein